MWEYCSMYSGMGNGQCAGSFPLVLWSWHFLTPKCLKTSALMPPGFKNTLLQLSTQQLVSSVLIASEGCEAWPSCCIAHGCCWPWWWRRTFAASCHKGLINCAWWGNNALKKPSCPCSPWCSCMSEYESHRCNLDVHYVWMVVDGPFTLP